MAPTNGYQVYTVTREQKTSCCFSERVFADYSSSDDANQSASRAVRRPNSVSTPEIQGTCEKGHAVHAQPPTLIVPDSNLIVT